jgi:hypothetical protein
MAFFASPPLSPVRTLGSRQADHGTVRPTIRLDFARAEADKIVGLANGA